MHGLGNFVQYGYGPIVHSHIAPTYVCLFLLPSKQSSGKRSIYGFCFGRREEDIKKVFADSFITLIDRK